MPLFIHNKIEDFGENLSGMFHCPFCGIHRHYALHCDQNIPEIVLRFTRCNTIRTDEHLCVQCNRPLWLEKVFDHEGKLVLDTYQWIENEVKRFRNY